MNVGVAEAKDRLSELIERAEHGEPITITRHGRPVATLNAKRTKPTLQELDALFADIRKDAKDLPELTHDEIVAAVRADRRF